MVKNQQRITLMQLKIETLEKEIKQLRKEVKEVKEFDSILSCEYIINKKSYKLNQAIVNLIDSSYTRSGK